MDLVVFRRFIAQAIQCSGEPALGLLAGLMLQPYHSQVGIAAVTSRDVGHGLQFMSRHGRLLFGRVDFHLEAGPRWSIFKVRPTRPLHEVQDFVTQFIVGAHWRLLEAMLGRPADELVVCLPHARPAGGDLTYQRYLRNVEFDHEHLAFAMPAELLRVPCVSANAKEFLDAARACQQTEAELAQGQFAHRVRRALVERLTKDPGSRELASDLGISVQTMARRLAESGTTYSDLKEQLRKSQATWYLQNTDLPIEAIASQLGYAELTSFSRAFKRWHCVSPRAMRQSLRSGAEDAA
ncbi:AraC-like DNA-binding protein [Variovorax sp. Sphag1AA]|nr:AraC-like DNA-binding protein [Variovorax sp. Sphag1AA]